jgi:hypothetical protein
VPNDCCGEELTAATAAFNPPNMLLPRHAFAHCKTNIQKGGLGLAVPLAGNNNDKSNHLDLVLGLVSGLLSKLVEGPH